MIKIISLLFCLTIALEVNGQETAHQSVLYVQSIGGMDATGNEDQILQNSAAVTAQLSAIVGCGKVINVIISTSDVIMTPSDDGKTLTGPDYEGNNVWMDATVDWLILVEPGPAVVTLYGKNSNGEIYGLISGGSGDTAIIEMLDAAKLKIPYPNRNYCILKSGLNALACSTVGDLSDDGCSVSLEEPPLDIVNTDLENELDEDKYIIAKEVKDYFLSNYCTPIVVYATNRIEYFENDEILSEEFMNAIQERTGYDNFLLFVKGRGADPGTVQYVLKVQFYGSTTPETETCLSLIQGLTNEQLKSLEGKKLTSPTIDVDGEIGQEESALVELDGLLRGKKEEDISELCRENMGKITWVKTYIPYKKRSIDDEFIITWNNPENVDFFYITLIDLNNDNVSSLTSIQLNELGAFQKNEKNECILAIKNNNPFGVRVDREDSKMAFIIFPFCSGMIDEGNYYGDYTYYRVSGIIENFQYKDQGVCPGHTARLGKSFKYNDGCNDVREYDEVRLDLYSFDWQGDENIIEEFFAECGTEEFRTNSRGIVLPSHDGIYTLTRHHNNTFLRDSEASLFLDENGQPFSVNMEDVAEVHVNIFDIYEEPENYSKCMFSNTATDETLRTIDGVTEERVATSENNTSNVLFLVSEANIEESSFVQVKPTDDDGSSFTFGESGTSPTWEKGTINAPLSPGRISSTNSVLNAFISLPEFSGKGIINLTPPDDKVFHSSTPQDANQDYPFGDAFYSEYNAIAQNENENVAPFEVGIGIAEVNSYPDPSVEIDYGVVPFLENVCNYLSQIQAILEGLFGVVPVGGDNGPFSWTVSCSINQDQFIEKWTEIFNHPNLIRNREGHIDIFIGGSFEININVLQSNIVPLWVNLAAAITQCEAGVYAEANIEAGAVSLFVNENSFIAPDGSKMNYSWDLSEELIIKTDDPTISLFEARCNCQTLVNLVATASGMPPGSLACPGSANMSCRLAPLILVWGVNCSFRENPVTGSLQYKITYSPVKLEGKVYLACEYTAGVDPEIGKYHIYSTTLYTPENSDNNWRDIF